MPITPLPTNPIDLCVVDDVANWANMNSALSTASTPDQQLRNIIQEVITGWSEFVNWRTGRDPGYFTGTGGGTPDFTTFNEVRDGNSADSMAVLNGPINMILSVKINGQQIPVSTDWNVLGYFIEQNPTFIGLRRGTGFLSGFTGIGLLSGFDGSHFVYGKGNVFISYKGGYKSTPPDLFEKSLRAINVIVSKRLREDEGARTTPATGAISNYRTFPWEKDIILTLMNYARTVLSF